MKLIFIYGPPAIGKLTVAKELVKLTNYKLFHNHMTLDTVAPILEFDTDAFWGLVERLRLLILEEAAKQKVKGTIFTYCYDYPEDGKWIRKLVKTIEKHKSKNPSPRQVDSSFRFLQKQKILL